MQQRVFLPAVLVDAGFTQDERDEIIRQSLEMRKLRMSFDAIGRHFGVSAKTAATWVNEKIRENVELSKAEAVELRELEMGTLDQLQVQLMPAIENGSIAAIKVALQISERRSKLLGLDAPENHNVTVMPQREYVGVNMDKV